MGALKNFWEQEAKRREEQEKAFDGVGAQQTPPPAEKQTTPEPPPASPKTPNFWEQEAKRREEQEKAFDKSVGAQQTPPPASPKTPNFWEQEAKRREEQGKAFDKSVGVKQTPSTTTVAPSAQQQTSTPPTTTATPKAERPQPTEGGYNAVDNLANILGKSPEQKAVEEEKLKRASQSRQMIAGFFDALRNIGMAIGGGASGIPVPQLSDTAGFIRELYTQDKADRDKLDAESAAYKLKVYQMNKEEKERARREAEAEETKEYNRNRQAAQDKRDEEEHQQKLKTEQARENYIKTQEKYLSGKPYTTGRSTTGAVKYNAEVKKKADQWGRSYPKEAKEYWKTHERTTENEAAFNDYMSKKYAKKSQGAGSKTQGKGKGSKPSGSSSSSSKKSRKLKE